MKFYENFSYTMSSNKRPCVYLFRIIQKQAIGTWVLIIIFGYAYFFGIVGVFIFKKLYDYFFIFNSFPINSDF